ncbi:hypothetical protein BD779DRAFT_1538018 [Infundibulicybe gibba]|nr:hypothetical protein BD779DRAFT_1538018 [Infundibulicybe gibba]
MDAPAIMHRYRPPPPPAIHSRYTPAIHYHYSRYSPRTRCYTYLLVTTRLHYRLHILCWFLNLGFSQRVNARRRVRLPRCGLAVDDLVQPFSGSRVNSEENADTYVVLSHPRNFDVVTECCSPIPSGAPPSLAR